MEVLRVAAMLRLAAARSYKFLFIRTGIVGACTLYARR
jgi:hypothetical protein